MDTSAIASLPPAQLREIMPRWVSGFIEDERHALANRERIHAVVQGWSDEDCRSIVASMRGLGSSHRIYPAHPALRVLTRAWCRDVVLEPVVGGVEHLQAAVAAGPTMILGNHLSYLDANATDAALAWSGSVSVADRIVAAAGPKVYEDLFRLLAAACLNTLPVPQSTTLEHTAKLSPRELAHKALAGVEAAQSAMEQGYVPLVYPEGSRTRSGHLGPFIRGVHRWLKAADHLQVVPLAIEGTESIMPIEATRMRPGRVTLRFGAPLVVGRDGSSREVLEAAHRAVGVLLPDPLRPPADTPATI